MCCKPRGSGTCRGLQGVPSACLAVWYVIPKAILIFVGLVVKGMQVLKYF